MPEITDHPVTIGGWTHHIEEEQGSGFGLLFLDTAADPGQYEPALSAAGWHVEDAGPHDCDGDDCLLVVLHRKEQQGAPAAS